MPLQRISASALGAPTIDADAAAASSLGSEAIRIAAGGKALNRRADQPTALIVAEGFLRIGTLDDHAALHPGDGVLLPAGQPYSLVADTDATAILFSVPPAP